MDVKTARRYVKAGKSPQEMRPAHTWRTREDPVKAIWPQAERMLQDAPELQATMLFEHLTRRATRGPLTPVRCGRSSAP